MMSGAKGVVPSSESRCQGLGSCPFFLSPFLWFVHFVLLFLLGVRQPTITVKDGTALLVHTVFARTTG